MLLPWAFDQINLGKDVVYFTSILVTLITSISQLWLVVVLTNAVAEAVVASPRINPRSIDAQMVRVCFRLLSVGAFVLIVLRTAHNLGIPLTPVLAGLGVGGLAVALAAQNSLENLIGGFNLFTDYGEFLGVAEDLNLRIMEIVSRARTSLAVPVQRTLLERVPEPGRDRVLQTEEQVRKWRENNQLYLPSFPEDVVAQLRDRVQYPPEGSPPG